MRGGVWLGADVGGTNLVAALVNSGGRVVESVTFPTDPSPRVALARLAREERRLVLSASPRARLLGAGLAVPGDIDHEGGRIRVSPNLPLWNGAPVGRWLRRRLRVPVTVENDATAAAWGAFCTEVVAGNLLCVTLGTGVGGGLVLDGRLFRGATGTAGEFGHMVMDPRGPRCRCGNRGCVEAYAGAYGLLAAARRAGLRVRSIPYLRRLALSPSPRRGEGGGEGAVARRIFREAYTMLGIALAGVVNLLNLDAVVLTGGIAHSGDLVLRPVRAAVRRYTFAGPARHVKIALARDKDHLGVIGAALLARRRS